MKRILALLLTVVLLTLALTSCAYNYEKKAKNLVDFNKADFESALKSLSVEEGEFASVSKRNTLVWDSILQKSASAVGTDDKIKTGSADKNDVVYYCYYAVDTDGHQFFTATNMKNNSEVSFQMGLSTLKGLNKTVAEAIAAFDFENAYTANTAAETPETTAVVSVSYKMTRGGEDTTVTNAIVSLDDQSDSDLVALYTKLAETKVGSYATDADKTNVFTVGDTTFTNAKVDYVVNGTPFTVSYTDTENDTQRTAANGVKESLKDVELTYYIYPVSYIAVDDLTEAFVVSKLISSLSADSLDVFKTNDAENDLYKAAKAYADAKKAFDDAKKAYDDAAADGKEAAETAMNEKKTAMEDALTQLKAADASAYANLSADEKTAAIDHNVEGSAICAAYYDNTFDSLQASFNADVQKKVYAAVYKEIEKIKVNEVPAKAVKNTYKELMDAYECTFYQGTSTKDTSKSNYKYYNELAKKDNSNASAFELYLMAETASETPAEAKNFVTEQAKKLVESTVRVYALADIYGVKLSKKEIKTESNTYASTYSINASGSYGQIAFTEEAAKTAIYFDHVMAIIAGSTTNDAGELSWNMVSYVK